ncbi:MAG: hypothetical protein FWC68_02830, partial [Oscillospiraceae bacterium]|nr:hypothetical protein [Oscillospiraceae bacterium]
MLLYRLLEKEKKNLKFLGNSDKNIEVVLNMITELKQHSINTLEFEEVGENIEDIYLKTKMQDINKIHTLYEQQIQGKYIDEDDALTILAKQLDETNMFKNSLIYIDEFSNFTTQEYNILSKLLQSAESITVAMCANPEEINTLTNPETDIFYYNKKTAMKLIELARDGQIEIKEPILLKESHRFKNKELKHLEENIYSHIYKKYSENVSNISLFLATNPYTELENIAQNIIKLVKEEGYRYSDIAIITKNTEEIEAISKTIFDKYDIPIFIDQKEDINQNILVKYILSIIDIFAKSWSADTVFAYLKSGLYDEIEKKDIYKLENYCTKWGIRGSKWYKQDWEHDPTQNLNDLRRKIADPLLKFKQDVESRTVKEITTALYTFLEENKIREKLNKKIDYFTQINEAYIAEEYKKSFDILIDLLDEIVLVFGEEKMSFASYSSILQI